MRILRDVMKILKTMTDHLTMAINVKSRALHVGPPNETLNYPSNVWYKNHSQYGHRDQSCQFPRNPMPTVPQDCFQNHLPVGPNHQLPQRIICFTCNMMHLVGFDIC